MVFTVAYGLAFLYLLSSRLDYSRPARNFAYFLIGVVMVSVKDSVSAVMLPAFATVSGFERFLAGISPLYLYIPVFSFNMLMSAYNVSIPPDRQFRKMAQFTIGIAAVITAMVVLMVIWPSLFYVNLQLPRSGYCNYTYKAGPLMVLYTLLQLLCTGIPAFMLVKLSVHNRRSEAFFIGVGALISLSAAVATTTLPALTQLQNLPRFGCLSMVVVCTLTFYAMYRYGRISPVAGMLQEQERSHMIVDSLESLVEIDNQGHLFQRTCDYARETSESMLSCIISFEEDDRSYRVRTIAAGSEAIEETVCSQLPLTPQTLHALREVAGIEHQLTSRRPLEFRSLKEFFGNSGAEVTWTKRLFMFDFKQIISYPILFDRKVWGALVLFRERVLEQIDLLRIFSIQCSLVLRFSRQIKELEKMRTLEDQLHQSQKMEAIGQLAGGIAHDFNNMLSGISGYAQLIKRRFTAEKPELKMYADSMLAAAKSASELTDKLLAFARKGKFQTVAIDIHDTIRTVIELLTRTIDKRITIGQQFCAQKAVIIGDPTQVQNLILNLALNARNAMPGGGELLFKTDTAVIRNNDLFAHHQYEIKDGNYLVLSVIDTGIGMTEEVKKRLFEPFFTTQNSGKGTGLGLASVYGTVKNHGGFIEVESQVGKGATFKVNLPLAADRTAPIDTMQKTQELIRGEGHILVVDDEEMIRRLSEEILSFLGYTVHTCSDGIEAIDYYRANEQKVDLVILDVMMQKMDGYETYRHLRGIRDDVRVIIMTGYSLKEDTHQTIVKGVAGFIKKPFEGAELSRLIHEVMTTGHSSSAF